MNIDLDQWRAVIGLYECRKGARLRPRCRFSCILQSQWHLASTVTLYCLLFLGNLFNLQWWEGKVAQKVGPIFTAYCWKPSLVAGVLTTGYIPWIFRMTTLMCELSHVLQWIFGPCTPIVFYGSTYILCFCWNALYLVCSYRVRAFILKSPCCSFCFYPQPTMVGSSYLMIWKFSLPICSTSVSTIISCRCVQTKRISDTTVFTVTGMIWSLINMLLLMSGDVEPNPGPMFTLTLSNLATLPVASAWRPLGFHLGLTDHQLNNIEARHTGHQHFLYDCLMSVFEIWIENGSEPTSEELAIALTAIGKTDAAKHILDEKGKIPEIDAMENCAQYLKDIYQKRPQEDSPLTEGTNYVSTTLIECSQHETMMENESKDRIHEGVDKVRQYSTEVKISNLLCKDLEKPPMRVLIEGTAGSGKSTLCRKLCWDWAAGLFRCYLLVVLLRLGDTNVANARNIQDLFDHILPAPYQQVISSLEDTGGNGLLLILDGFDELPAERRMESPFRSIIEGEMLPECTVLVTSRPYASASLSLHAQYHIEILGFTENQIYEYIVQHIPDQEKATELREALLDRPNMMSLCNVPLNCAIITYIYRQHMFTLPTSITELYEIFFCHLLSRHIRRSRIGDPKLQMSTNSIHKLAQPLDSHFICLCELAYTGVVQRKILFTSENLRSSIGEISDVKLLSLMATTRHSVRLGQEYYFLHLSIQEFLAALWVATRLQPEQQVAFVEGHLHKGSFRTAPYFLAGMTKLTSSSALELLCKKIAFTSTQQNVASSLCFISLCHIAHESQNRSICQAAVSNAAVSLQGCKVTPFDCMALGYLLSSCPSWRLLDLSHCSIDDRCIKHLAVGISECHSLHTLNASNNHIVHGIQVIAELLRGNVVISELDVSGNPIDVKGVLALVRSLRRNNSLEKLQLNCIPLSSQAAENLAYMLKANQHLRELEVSNTHIPEKGIMKLVEALSHNTTLMKLNLSYNPMSEGGARSLAKMLHTNACLKELYLGNNSMSAVAVTTLVNALADNTTLKKLYLNGNNSQKMVLESGIATRVAAVKKQREITEVDSRVFSENGTSKYYSQSIPCEKKQGNTSGSFFKKYISNPTREQRGLTIPRPGYESKYVAVFRGNGHKAKNESHSEKISDLRKELEKQYKKWSNMVFVPPYTTYSTQLSTSSLSTSAQPTTYSREVNLAALLEKSQGKCILIEGGAGIGKTTFVRKQMSEWGKGVALQSFSIVLYIPLAETEGKSLDNWGDLADLAGTPQVQGSQIGDILRNAKKILIVVDGWDIFISKHPDWQHSLICNLVTRQSFPESTVIITSRPLGLHTFFQITKPDLHVEMQGFSSENVLQYFRLLTQHMERTHKEKLLTFLDQYPAATQLCSIPLACEIIIKYYENHQYILPNTLTQFISIVTLGIMKREVGADGFTSTHESGQFSNLPDAVQNDFGTISRLALADVNRKQATQSPRELSYFCVAECIPGIENIQGMGLVEASAIILPNGSLQPSYKFLHPIIHMFLAASAVQDLPLLNQLEFIWRHTDDLTGNLELLCHFYFGLSPVKHSGAFSPTKLALPSTTELLIHRLQLETNPQIHKQLFLFGCLFEAQEVSLWRRIAKHQKLMQVSIGKTDLKIQEKHTLALAVCNSGISSWQLQAPESCECFAEDLRTLIATYSTTPIDLTTIPSSNTILGPHIPEQQASETKKVGSADKPKTLHSFYCRSLKDTCHQIFQFYSPVQVRSDCSDPSYVSFISCQCLEERVKSHVVFQPVPATHWVQLPPKKSSKRGKSRTSEAEALHMEQHDNVRTEMIILTTPYLQKVKFFVQATSEEVFIQLFSEDEPSPSEGRIVTCAMEDLRAPETLVQCQQPSLPTHTNSMLVVGPMPLPRKQQTDSTSQFTPIQTQEHQPSTQPLQEARRDHDMGVAQPVPSPPAVPASYYSQYPTAPTESHAMLGRSAPGTILFSTLPSMFEQDRIYPLPDESHCIRKGGNGQVFAGNYSGISLAVKRTTLRMREFSIVTRLSHINIMPILTVMMGKQHPEHKRRHLCHYFMPRMSGDCARMITDHRDLTLIAIRRKYRNNPRMLGVVQGNLRYLLGEILKGLNYLHSLRIVHRDIKASNILVKLQCSCEEPLTCRCSNKCRVVLSDFDSSCVLDHRNQLTPIRTVIGPVVREVYYVAPVGTNGFRPPESSLQTVANDHSAIIPSLTTAADIWSFGILLLRLLIGADGPSSQREVAMLLLHYHQQKEMKEGSHRSPFQPLSITEAQVADLLKLTKLKMGLRGMEEAVDFVRSCLKVDPFARATAAQLLVHKFLRLV